MPNINFIFKKVNPTSYARMETFPPRTTYGHGLLGRIHYIHRGNEYFLFQGKEYTLKPGIFYFFPYNIDYRLYYDEEGCDHSYIDFITSPIIKCEALISISPEIDALAFSALSALFSYINSYPKINNKGSRYYEGIITAHLTCFLDTMHKNKIIEPFQNENINLVLDYIHKNFQNDISLQDLADLVHMEKNAFIRYFKKHTFYTPYYYLKAHRLNSAATLVENGMPISEVADLLGYSSMANFSKAFNKHFGYYPSTINKNK